MRVKFVVDDFKNQYNIKETIIIPEMAMGTIKIKYAKAIIFAFTKAPNQLLR